MTRQRLDVYLKTQHPNLSRGEIRALLSAGRVLLDGQPAKKGDQVGEGQEVVADLSPLPKAVEGRAQIAVGDDFFVYVDDNIIVVNKPAGMPSHPLVRGESGTALDAVVERFPEVATASDDAREGGLCHRLDNDTSGLLMFARNVATYERMREAFSNGEIKRTYVALVEGNIEAPLVLERPIAHHAKNQAKMMVVGDGVRRRGKPQKAITRVEPMWRSTLTLNPSPAEREREIACVGVEIEGGRRHQIRVHLAHAGHPLVGDTLYGGMAVDFVPAQALHAWKMTLPNGEKVEAPLPDWARER